MKFEESCLQSNSPFAFANSIFFVIYKKTLVTRNITSYIYVNIVQNGTGPAFPDVSRVCVPRNFIGNWLSAREGATYI